LFINARTQIALRTYVHYCIGPMMKLYHYTVLSSHCTDIRSWGHSCMRSQCGTKWRLSRLWPHSKQIASSGQFSE